MLITMHRYNREACNKAHPSTSKCNGAQLGCGFSWKLLSSMVSKIWKKSEN